MDNPPEAQWRQKPRPRSPEGRGWATKEDLALLEPGEGTVWLVELTICRWWADSTCDRGVLGFDNGVLYFAGLACSFAIGSQDLSTEQPPKVSPFVRWSGARNTRIRLRYHRELELDFSILARWRQNLQKEEAELESAIAEFATQPPTAAPRSYPPLSRWREEP